MLNTSYNVVRPSSLTAAHGFDTTETKREKKFTFPFFTLKTVSGLMNSLIWTKETLPVLLSSKKRKWYVPGTNIGFDKLFSNGNSKLDKNILIFSILPIVTCLNCKDCKGSCYAKKACLQYDNTWNKRTIVTYLALNHLELLEEIICKELSRTKKTKVRIHESGDFFNVEYINMWKRVAAKFHHIRFYFYTKVENLKKFKAPMSELIHLDNVNRVLSILPNGGLNFGSFEYVKAMHEKYNIPVCSYGLTEEEKKELGICDNMHCGANCTICLYSEYVLFKEH